MLRDSAVNMGEHKHEERLNASDLRYRVLFQENPFPMWLYDVATLRFLDVNDAAVEHYGYTRDEFLAMLVTDIRPTEDVPRLLALVEQTASDGNAWKKTGQWRHRLRSGELVEVEVLSHPIEFDGRAARVVIAHDITEHHRRGVRLDEAEDRIRFALEASRLGIWETNFQTGVSYWSESCETMHGLASGTFGQTFDAFIAAIHADDREAVQARISAAIKDHHAVELEYRATWPDGTEHWIASTARFFYDDHGAPTRGAGVAIDVTERRALEAQLRQAQKMDAIGQLAGGIAHDFNNMLTAILGNAEILIEESSPGTLHTHLLEEIRRAGRSAASLTRQLLAFSRKQVLSMRVLHLGDVVGEVTPMLRRLVGEAVDLKAVVGDTQHVKADAGQLQQILVNLAVNARDAMPDGGQLTIETHDVELDDAYAKRHPGVRPGGYVMLAVSDTGHGIDRAIQRRIFEPFFTTKAKGQGTGLGLATVHGIVKQSDGHVWLYSEVGRGTTFKIYLPQTLEPETSSEKPRIDPRRLQGAETVLLVEDEDVVRSFASRALTEYGYAVHAMADPDRAIEFADAYGGVIEALVTDVVLPGMNGRTMATRIQAKHPETKVLFVSGYTDSAIVHHGVLEPGMWFLEKPFSAEGLGLKVRQLLDTGT